MRGTVAIVALILSSCYEPAVRDCMVVCVSGDRCAEGQVCGADGFCASPEVAGRCDELLDAQVDGVRIDASDVRDPDASAELCAQGCTNGTCDGGVCVIDCSVEGSCSEEMYCPANLPCRVLCTSDYACPRRIFCTEASSCDIICSGPNSCRDEVRCGTGPCHVECSGDGSCPKKSKCSESCGCDVECTGIGSCGDGSECPGAGACSIGFGCTSQLPGCDSC